MAFSSRSGLWRTVSGRKPVAASVASMGRVSNSSEIMVPIGRTSSARIAGSGSTQPSKYREISFISPMIIRSVWRSMSSDRAMAQCSVRGMLQETVCEFSGFL